MKAGKSDLESLRLVLPKKFGGEGNDHNSKQTMVFGDDINILMSACRWTRDNTSPDLHGKVAVFHSRRSPRAKKTVLERFATGDIKVLFTTEAAGMVGKRVCNSGLCLVDVCTRVVICHTSSWWFSSWYRDRCQFGCSVRVERVAHLRCNLARFCLYSRIPCLDSCECCACVGCHCTTSVRSPARSLGIET